MCVCVCVCARACVRGPDEILHKELQVGNDQEKAQSERNSHSKTEVGKPKLTIGYIYLENIW